MVNFSKIDPAQFKGNLIRPELRSVEEHKSNVPVGKRTNMDKALDNELKDSKLDERMPNKASLAKNGFKASDLIDMNGGQWFKNDKGESVRICEFDGKAVAGAKAMVEYNSKDGLLKHQIYYDSDGNPMKGSAYVKNDDGTTTVYNFEYDLDGNRVVTDQSCVK